MIHPSNSWTLAKQADGIGGFLFTKTDNPADVLRQLVEWCDWQFEDHFTPEGGMSVGDLIHLYQTCVKSDVETPECLEALRQGYP